MVDKRRVESDSDDLREAKRSKKDAVENDSELESQSETSTSNDESDTSETEEGSDRPIINDAQQFSILSEYTKASEQLRRQFKDLNSEEGPKLVQKSLDKVESIFRESKWTKDTTIIATDSDTFYQVSNQARVVAQNLSSGNISHGIQLKDVIDGWKSTFSSEETENEYNWANAGLLYESLSCRIHGIDFLNGPLEIERKKRVVKPKLVDDTKNKNGSVTANRRLASELLNPDSKNDTSQAAMKLYRKLVEHGERVPVFNFLHPTLFSKSVEMLFTISFLINNGRLILNTDDNGVPYIEVNDGENIKAMPRYEAEDEGKSHVIFTLDMETWRQLVEEYEIKEPLFVL